MTKYKSYGSKGGRFEEKDPGYGSLKELRRRDQTLINASKQNALAIEKRGKEYISSQQRSDAKEIQNKQEIHSFEQKKLDLREKNIRIASQQIMKKGKDEAKHHLKVGKLLSDLSESAGKIATNVGKAWEKAGQDIEERDSLREQLESNTVNEETVKAVIEAKLKDATSEAEKNKYMRQLEYLDQSSTGVPNQASLMWHYLGFSGKYSKFNARAKRAAGGAKLNFEEWQAKVDENGNLINKIDHTSVKSYNKGYNAWAEGYLRANGLWNSSAPEAMKLQRSLLKTRVTHNEKQKKDRNEALSLEQEATIFDSIRTDQSKENIATQMLNFGTLANTETNVAYTDAEVRDKIFNYYAEDPRIGETEFDALLDQPAGRMKNGVWEAHKSGKSWRETYPLQSDGWLNKRSAAINARKNRATAKAEGRDQEGLQKITQSVFAQPDDDNFEGSLNEAVLKELDGNPGTILEWFDAAKIEHAANPKTLDYIQKLEWNTLQNKDTATTDQLVKHLYKNSETEELINVILTQSDAGKRQEYAEKYLPGIKKLKQAGINFKDLNKEIEGIAKTDLGLESVQAIKGIAPVTLKLAVAETTHRYIKEFNKLVGKTDPATAKAGADDWLQEERKKAKDDPTHWLHVTGSDVSGNKGDQAFFTKYMGIADNTLDPKSPKDIKKDHANDPLLYQRKLQHSEATLAPVIEDLRNGSYVHIPSTVRESAKLLGIPLKDYLYHQVMLVNDGKVQISDEKSVPWAKLGMGPKEMTLAINPIGANWVNAVNKATDIATLNGLAGFASAINNGADHLKLSRAGNTVDVGFAHSEHSYPAAVGNRLNAVISWAKDQGLEIKSDQIIPNKDISNYNTISILNGKDLIHPKPGSPLNDALDMAVDQNGRRLFRPCYVTDINQPGAYSGRPTCYKRN